VSPEKFTDAGRYGDEREAAANRTEIAQQIEQLAARKLPAGQRLEVEVLDVVLAGFLEYRPFWNEQVRVMRDATWPSIKLRYRLTQGEQVVASGEETVSDMRYLERPNPYSTTDRLRYEKRMLDEWFEERIVERKAALR
jgi:hypothetical protein